MWEAIYAYQELKGKGFWYDLKFMSDFVHLWEYIRTIPFTFLTATGNPKYNAQEQKSKTIENKFPNIPVIFTRKSQEKSLYAETGSVLIDDRWKSIDPWVKAGGIGILHTDAVSTVRILKSLGLKRGA